MKISIASYSFHGLVQQGAMDVFGYLESMRYRYGLDAADIWCGELLSDTPSEGGGMLPRMDEDSLRKVRDAIDEKEMTLANLCVDDAHVWDADATDRERLHQKALAHLRAAVILGAQTVRIDMGGESEEMAEEQFDHIVARYREYAQFAADNGFRVGPENHWGAARVPGNMERLFQAVDHPSFGLLLHLGNWSESPEDGDRKFASRAMHTHIAAQIARTCLEGRLRMLVDAGYQGYWGVEHHSGEHEYARVAWQLATVKEALVTNGWA